jgi:hypothetical protein
LGDWRRETAVYMGSYMHAIWKTHAEQPRKTTVSAMGMPISDNYMIHPFDKGIK